MEVALENSRRNAGVVSLFLWSLSWEIVCNNWSFQMPTFTPPIPPQPQSLSKIDAPERYTMLILYH